MTGPAPQGRDLAESCRSVVTRTLTLSLAVAYDEGLSKGAPRWPQRREGFEPSGEILSRVVDSCGIAGRLDEQRVIERWAEAVGPEVARHTSPGISPGAFSTSRSIRLPGCRNSRC